MINISIDKEFNKEAFWISRGFLQKEQISVRMVLKKYILILPEKIMRHI